MNIYEMCQHHNDRTTYVRSYDYEYRATPFLYRKMRHRPPGAAHTYAPHSRSAAQTAWTFSSWTEGLGDHCTASPRSHRTCSGSLSISSTKTK